MANKDSKKEVADIATKETGTAKLAERKTVSAFTKIADDLYAHEIPALGCIVSTGSGLTFVPMAKIVDGKLVSKRA